jgi:exoribonuclease R
MLLKIHIDNRNYDKWEWFDGFTLEPIEYTGNPINLKLFTEDIIEINKDETGTDRERIVHSSVRQMQTMPGILVLTDKTYGKYKNKKLYKCIPDDRRFPVFLVPYDDKTNNKFNKNKINQYVTFAFLEWSDNQKHPYGILTNTIGPVDVLSNFYEYQLYCKSLHASIQKFQKDTIKSLENKCHDGIIETIINKYPNIEDRTNQSYWNIITIDPQNSVDYDDGFSIVDLDKGVKQLSIYISNVTIWMDVLNLWNSFSRRISTIYLPDKKRPMLPTILSDCLCSLQQNVRRVAFVMDVFIKENQIIDIKFCNAVIKVSNNYVYEDPNLLGDQKYHNILETTHELCKKYKYMNSVRNSHELVSYLMILMNYHCAKELIKHKTGIFRSTIIKRDFSVPDTLPEDVGKFIKIWNSASGQYIDGSEIVATRHEFLDVDAYIHITSPIRRLVDLLNMIKFQTTTGMISLSQTTNQFYEKWLNELEYINVTMRSIRKLQCDCTLLDLCHNNPEIMEKDYDGYLFDKL